MSKDRRLGRGLEALLGRPAAQENGEPSPGPTSPADVDRHGASSDQPEGERLLALSVYDIDTNPFQPRTVFDEAEIAKLAESIGRHGLLQPVIVRRDGERYQLISGERRWRTAIRAGFSEITASVRDVDDRQMAEMTIVENLQRRDLGPLEKADSFHQYLKRYECTQEELAGRLSVDRSTIANLIRLLELPDAVKNLLSEGRISAGHARALLPLGDEREQESFARRIQKEQLSVRATEQLISEVIQNDETQSLKVVGGRGTSRKGKSSRSQHLSSLEQELRTALGTRVEIRQAAKGRGKIIVHFASHAEFDRLRTQLGGEDKSHARAG